MKTIFQMGFRPANPFTLGRNPFVLSQDEISPDQEITGEPTVMPPEAQITTPAGTALTVPATPNPAGAAATVPTTPTQQTTTPTTPSQQAPGGKPTTSVEQGIAQGISQGVQEGTKAYAQTQAQKAAAAKAAAAAKLPGAPGATVGGIDSSTIVIGIGAVALVAIIAIVAA